MVQRALEDVQIEAVLLHAHARTLLWVFGPYVPIGVAVAPEHAARATEISDAIG